MMDIPAFIDRFQATDALSRRMGIRVTALTEQGAEAELDITPEVQNYMGLLHGGAYFTIADVVAGLCVSYYGEQCVTLSSNLNFIKAAQGGKIFARSSLCRRGRKVCVCDIHISGEAGELLCSGTFTMYLSGKPVPSEG